MKVLFRSAISLCLLLVASISIAAETQKKVDFVYFGTQWCSYCRGWLQFDLPKLQQSEAFQKVRFTKVEKAITAQIPPASSFPPEIAGMRDTIAEFPGLKDRAASPMFAIVVDGKAVWGKLGVPRNEDVIAEIEKALATTQ